MKILKDRFYEWEVLTDENACPCRKLFLINEFEDWYHRELTTLKKDRGIISPKYQVIAFFDEFVGNINAKFVSDFQNLNPQGDDVYEMRITDVRIFGWFLIPGVFIAVSGVLKREAKGKSLKPYLKKVIKVREGLKLHQPDSVRSKVGIHELL
ncbi:hypothetical protein [Kiloniella spongiae]|uniref:hypothetical protein n=1 Tax=Kiloniella spongiae TaxID=1489064 RepID=UPI0012E0724E|nr:hypothetical protein [Kiloniella spongiae]